MKHRVFVGGDFEKIGRWQFDYLIQYTGLVASDRFLDIACGSLRLGKLMIPHLHTGNYYGVEAEQEILDAGIQHELSSTDKNPNFSVNSEFDFSFCPGYDIAWSNSLLSHLTMPDISLLFNNLRSCTSNNSRFYFTYFDRGVSGKLHYVNPDQSHARKDFFYSQQEILSLLSDAGWYGELMTEQSHPRKQQIVCARLK